MIRFADGIRRGAFVAELEHMNANFIRAMGQYEELRNAPSPVQPQRTSCTYPSSAIAQGR